VSELHVDDELYLGLSSLDYSLNTEQTTQCLVKFKFGFLAAVIPDGVQQPQACHRNRSILHLVNLQPTFVQLAAFV